jgi:hypothetical protein
MQEHSIGINLFDVGVRKYVTISSRKEYLGRGSPFILYGGNPSGAEKCSQSFGPEKATFTVYIQLGDRDSRIAEMRSIMALKERQVIDHMNVINSVSGDRHVPTE